MDWRATLTLDYNGADPNRYQRLQNAICQAGWGYAETSAFYIECQDLTDVRRALEILSRYVHEPGDLSAMTLTVQLVGPDRDPPAAQNHANALEQVLQSALPSQT